MVCIVCVDTQKGDKLTVSNMVVTDIVEEEPSHPAKERTINRSSRATKERPFLLPVVRDCRVGVM